MWDDFPCLTRGVFPTHVGMFLQEVSKGRVECFNSPRYQVSKILEVFMTSKEREEVVDYLNKIVSLSDHNRIEDSCGRKVRCDWDIGDAEVDDNIGYFDAFTFWLDGGEDYVSSQFNVILTDDNLLDGSGNDLSFQDIKNFCSKLSVIETHPISFYLL